MSRELEWHLKRLARLAFKQGVLHQHNPEKAAKFASIRQDQLRVIKERIKRSEAA